MFKEVVVVVMVVVVVVVVVVVGGGGGRGEGEGLRVGVFNYISLNCMDYAASKGRCL